MQTYLNDLSVFPHFGFQFVFFFCLQLHKADKRYLIIISTRASQGVDGNDDGSRVDV